MGGYTKSKMVQILDIYSVISWISYWSLGIRCHYQYMGILMTHVSRFSDFSEMTVNSALGSCNIRISGLSEEEYSLPPKILFVTVCPSSHTDSHFTAQDVPFLSLSLATKPTEK